MGLASAVLMKHDKDPKDVILDAIKGLAEQYTPMNADVLVATYMRPAITAGGLHLPDSVNGLRSEDEFQGKIGLVVSMGELAFREDDDHKFGDPPKVGDWVVYSVGDTFGFKLGSQPMRLVKDVHIRGIVTSPDLVM